MDELIVLDVLEDRNGLIGLKEVEKSVRKVMTEIFEQPIQIVQLAFFERFEFTWVNDDVLSKVCREMATTVYKRM